MVAWESGVGSRLLGEEGALGVHGALCTLELLVELARLLEALRGRRVQRRLCLSTRTAGTAKARRNIVGRARLADEEGKRGIEWIRGCALSCGFAWPP